MSKPEGNTMNRDLLLRYLDGELAPDQMLALRERLDREPNLRAQLGQMQSLRGVLEAGRPESFSPFFSRRVINRIGSNRDPIAALYDSLRWSFTRTAVAGLALAGFLGAYNLLQYQSLGLVSSFLEAVFGLPSTSFADALTANGL